MNLRATQFWIYSISKFTFTGPLEFNTVTRTVHDTDLSVAEAGMEEDGCPRSPPECPVVVVPA